MLLLRLLAPRVFFCSSYCFFLFFYLVIYFPPFFLCRSLPFCCLCFPLN